MMRAQRPTQLFGLVQSKGVTTHAHPRSHGPRGLRSVTPTWLSHHLYSEL